MVLATADANHQPSARVVLCKELVADPGYVTFYTNYESQKGRACPTTVGAAGELSLGSPPSASPRGGASTTAHGSRE